MSFFDTQAGYDFATYTIPDLIRAIRENTAALERSRQAPPPCSLCPICSHFNDGSHSSVCADCVKDRWCRYEHAGASHSSQTAPINDII